MADNFFVNPSNSRKRTRPAPNGSRNSDKSLHKQARRPRSAPDAGDDVTSESESEMAAEADDIVEESDESDHETETDKRRRLAKEYLASLESELVEGFDAKDLDEDIIARRLQTDAAEQKGQMFRHLKTAEITNIQKTRVTKQRNLTTIASAANHLYVGSKDSVLTKWSYAIDELKPRLAKQRKIHGDICKGPILCMAVNTSDHLVVTGHSGGFAVHNAESLELLREFKITGDVLSCAFRRNTRELYVGGSDLRLRTYDLTQWAFVETLHGHQDHIVGLDALSQERCVSVGARDRTVIFWKIPEESRLTFRGGDTKLAARFANVPASDVALQEESRNTILEGSIDCCAMLDHQLFVTGSDNGNVSLWSTNRKKPQFIERLGHGSDDPLLPSQASGERDGSKVEIPPQLPRPISAIAAIPFSDTFFTGSWTGSVKMWTLAEDQRSFELVREISVGSGIVTGISVTEIRVEDKPRLLVSVCLSREPRLGRWLVKSGRDLLCTYLVSENAS